MAAYRFTRRVADAAQSAGAGAEAVKERPMSTPETPAGKHTIEVNSETGEARYVRPKDALPMKAVDLQHRLALDGLTYSGLAEACDASLGRTAVDYVDSYLAEMAPAILPSGCWPCRCSGSTPGWPGCSATGTTRPA
jgi:hypothetical protein